MRRPIAGHSDALDPPEALEPLEEPEALFDTIVMEDGWPFDDEKRRPAPAGDRHPGPTAPPADGPARPPGPRKRR